VKGLKRRLIGWKLVEGPNISDRIVQAKINQIEKPTKPMKYTGSAILPRQVANPKKKDKPDGPSLGERNKF
jgi:hypothetical protein